MARYIDADNLIDYIRSLSIWSKTYEVEALKSLNGLLNQIPTADVVEVVRCKDCIYGNKYSYLTKPSIDKVWCSLGNDMYAYRENDFCSYGERRQMGETMTFPETIEEFLEYYSFKDTDEVYTNGSTLIQLHWVMKAIEHYFPKEDK